MLIESAKSSLALHFRDVYLKQHHNISESACINQKKIVDDFMTLFSDEPVLSADDELDEYFSMKTERSQINGEPIKWWSERCLLFPNLSRLARDIHCIPGIFLNFFKLFIYLLLLLLGSSVAVERVFSSGRDTIAFRRSSLSPETIQTIMLIKDAQKNNITL